ncbi:MAG: OmpA family protein [Phycisphaerales bacterium]|nr:OmpA family protein [Phycisphaerales bacterium]
MTRTFSAVCAGALAVSTLALTGCVPQEKYDSLLQANRSMVEQLTTVNEERSTLMAQIKSRDAQLSQAASEIRRLQGEYSALGGRIESLNQSNEALATRLATMQPTALPADIERGMTALAAKYPEMLTFDEETGMIRLSSDLTFGSGSHELKTNAGEVIGELSTLLNDADLGNYQVLVIGHTDDVPLARSKPKYGTNLMLSAYRANSVRNAMVDSGMNADRIRIAGDGPNNPITENAEGGTEANRRVEIFLVARNGTTTEDTPAATATVDTNTTGNPVGQ